MAQPNLDSRVNEARQQLEMLLSPKPPISGPDGVDMPQPQPNSGFIPSPGEGQPSRMTLNPMGFPDARQAQPGDTPQNGLSLKAMSVDPTVGSNLTIDPSDPKALAELGSDVVFSGPKGEKFRSYTNPNALPEPTQEDNTPVLLEQRRQQAMEALKADGFDGYTPDISDAQQWDSTQQSMIGRAVQDIAAGFNASLARTLSIPRETADRALGLLGLDYMQHGSPQQQTIDALNRMGIPAYEVENLANKIGQGALPALATFTAMQLAAPSMAARQGTGMTAYMMREIGQWAVKHPVLGLWLGQASQAGGKTAVDVINPTSELGKVSTELGGELIGGALPGATKFAVSKIPGVMPAGRLAGKALGAGINTLSDALPTELGNVIKKYNPFYKQPISASSTEPLVNQNFDANRIQTFAKDQVYGMQTYQDKAIENAINSIPTTGTPAQVATRTHNLLQDAEKISKRIVSGFWERVPLRTKIAVSDLRRDIIRLKNELRDYDNTRPDAIIDKLIVETAPQRAPTGLFKATQMTIAKMRDYQGQVGTAMTEERAKDAPREGYIRNLARIADMIDSHVAAMLPNDTSIEQARQMSKRHNDLFSRGPINDILSKRRTGDFRVPQADSIDSLLQKTDGLAALKAVQDGVSTYPRIPTNRFRSANYYSNPFAVTPAEKAQLDELVKSAQDSIRASFREAADQGPEKAVAFSIKNEEAIKALGNVAGELSFAAQKVATALAEKKAITSSALARYAETSPDKAIANIFAQKDPSGTAHQLMIRFRSDPDALEGLRNETLKHFIYNIGKTNPNIMQKMLQEPRYQNLLETVLAPDQYARLTRMVNTAVRLGLEDATSLRQAFASPARTFGRIVGAKIGRMLNTGTIQTPGIISKATGDFVERRFGTTDPADMLAQAVLDPTWESLLYSRIPTTTRDMKAAEVKYRRLFAGINSSFQQTLNRLSKDKEDE